MAEKLADKLVREVAPPAGGNRVIYDGGHDKAITGFGLRVTMRGAKAFIFNYRVKTTGRERRYTIGTFPSWRTETARNEAAQLRRLVEQGHDPQGELAATREARTVSDLCDRYVEEHGPRKRTIEYDRSLIRRLVKPELGKLKLAAVNFTDVDRVHRKATKKNGPYLANRLHSLLVKMFGLAVRWQLRGDNPAKGVERNHEEPRSRYLNGEELARLSEALTAISNKTAANAIRLLLLTGARRGEVLNATWSQFDLDGGVWVKPSSHTKQRAEHRTPLSAAARMLLVELKRSSNGNDRVFPGATRGSLTQPWRVITKAADLRGVRLHDLRHSFASLLVSGGASLPLVGSLLGHTRPDTTARYAHLYDDTQRVAVERVAAAVIGNAETADVVSLRSGARR